MIFTILKEIGIAIPLKTSTINITNDQQTQTNNAIELPSGVVSKTCVKKS